MSLLNEGLRLRELLLAHTLSRRELYRSYGEHFAGKSIYDLEAIGLLRASVCTCQCSLLTSHVNISWVGCLRLGAHIYFVDNLRDIHCSYYRKGAEATLAHSQLAPRVLLQEANTTA